MAPSADPRDESRTESGLPMPGHFKRINKAPQDPVTREWNMFMNVSPDIHVILLRYPEKMANTPYTELENSKPIEFRIKPNFGLIEVDVPLNPYADTFDRTKGIMYGEAMRKSRVMKERGGSYGIAGGFGLGGSYAKARLGQGGGQLIDGENPTTEELLDDWDEAIKSGRVLTKVTLGGHINVWNETSPNLYVGHFQHGKWPLYRNNVFFTKVDALCVLRPQLAHIDALNDQAKSTFRMQAGADTEENEAVHVNMTIKRSEGESVDSLGDTGEIAKLLRAMREERWQRLSWVDSEAEESYNKFNETFCPKGHSGRSQLTCNMTNEQWLDAISCPRIDPIKRDVRAMRIGHEHDDLSSTDTGEEDESGGEQDIVSVESGDVSEDEEGGVRTR